MRGARSLPPTPLRDSQPRFPTLVPPRAHPPQDGQYKKTASNAKLRGLLPEYAFTPMKAGIARAVEWFVANYDTARK